MKVRILHIIDHLGYGGAQIVLRNIVQRTDKARFDTLVCVLRTNATSIPISEEVLCLNYGRYNPLSIPAIAALCKKRRIDIIHCHLQKSILSGLLAGFLCNCKVIIHEHGSIFSGGSGHLYRLSLRILSRKANVAIANSKATATALNRITGFPLDSIPVIGNFIDFDRFDYTRYDRKKVRCDIKLTPNDIVVGFVGRLDHCKGADLLLHAASILCSKNCRYRFVFVGDGIEKAKLQQLIGKLELQAKITFTGLRENPAEAISTFDVAVVPSRREAFGIAAVEFMRMRVPVIAAAIGGLPELIENGKTGILMENAKPETIAKAIDDLMKDETLRKTLTDNAEIFSRIFDGREQIRQISDLYDKLVQGRIKHTFRN